RTLVDGTLGVQLGGDVGTADQVHALAGGNQALVQVTQRVLAGADDHGVHRQHLRLTLGDADMQAGVIDLEVLDRVEHLYLLVLQAGAVDPAGGLAQAVADLGLLALQQEHLAGRRMHLRPDPGDAATGVQRGVDTPLLPEGLAVQAGGLATVGDEFGNVEADAAGADHRDLLADRFAPEDGVQAADHLGVLDAGDGRGARHEPGGQATVVESSASAV